jgi:hypothetical protein
MEVEREYQIGDKVFFLDVDQAPFIVIGVRKNHLEIRGDFSGGTHKVVQSDWIHVDRLIFHEPAMMCVDEGKCHHNCAGTGPHECFRRKYCAPIGDFLGDW